MRPGAVICPGAQHTRFCSAHTLGHKHAHLLQGAPRLAHNQHPRNSESQRACGRRHIGAGGHGGGLPVAQAARQDARPQPVAQRAQARARRRAAQLVAAAQRAEQRLQERLQVRLEGLRACGLGARPARGKGGGCIGPGTVLMTTTACKAARADSGVTSASPMRGPAPLRTQTAGRGAWPLSDVGQSFSQARAASCFAPACSLEWSSVQASSQTEGPWKTLTTRAVRPPRSLPKQQDTQQPTHKAAAAKPMRSGARPLAEPVEDAREHTPDGRLQLPAAPEVVHVRRLGQRRQEVGHRGGRGAVGERGERARGAVGRLPGLARPAEAVVHAAAAVVCAAREICRVAPNPRRGRHAKDLSAHWKLQSMRPRRSSARRRTERGLQP